MNTTNLISAPNITGNIGSCETKQVQSTIAQGLFVPTYEVTLTNSCTGQIIQQYQYNDYSGVIGNIAFPIIISFIIVGFIIFLVKN